MSQKTIRMKPPTHKTCCMIYAETYRNSGHTESRLCLEAYGKALDFIDTLQREEDGSLHIGSADMERIGRILNLEDQ